MIGIVLKAILLIVGALILAGLVANLLIWLYRRWPIPTRYSSIILIFILIGGAFIASTLIDAGWLTVAEKDWITRSLHGGAYVVGFGLFVGAGKAGVFDYFVQKFPKVSGLIVLSLFCGAMYMAKWFNVSPFCRAYVNCLPHTEEWLVKKGDELSKKENYADAFMVYSKAAENGSVEGRLNMAACLAEGRGCEQDQVRAFNEFSSKELSSLPLAKYYLACFALKGEVCERDPDRAFALLLDSARDGCKEAQFVLGISTLIIDSSKSRDVLQEEMRKANHSE